MKLCATFIMFFLLAAPPAWAADDMASEASVRQLMETTRARSLMDDTMSQMDGFIQGGMDHALAGRSPTAKQKAVLEEMKQSLVELVQQEMRWDVLEPKFVDVYRQAFTEQEVASMLAFYETPAGQAVIAKMPVVMQHSMAITQDLLVSMMPRMQEIQNEALHKLKTAE